MKRLKAMRLGAESPQRATDRVEPGGPEGAG